MELFRRKQKLVMVITILFAGIVLYCTINYFYINRHVKFQDLNMAYEISRTLGEDVDPDDVRYKDVYAIKELNIGQLGKYDTLEDIKLCKNLERISVNGGGDNWKPIEREEDITILSEKQAAYYQKELSDLIFSLSKLKEFYFSDLYGNCDITDFDFLKECDNLEILWIRHSDVKDFSFLNGCKNLKEIDLWGSQIKRASDLEILENLETICVYDTPLVQDENEIRTLCDAFPNAKIFISEGRVQNLDKKTD